MMLRDDEPCFRYALISDTHIRPRGLSSSPWKTNLQANERARWVAHMVNREAPDFVVHLGDVVHPVPHLETHASASQIARGIMNEIKSPVIYVPGNHDIGDKVNPSVPAHTVNPGFIEYFKMSYGPSYQAFTHKDVRFITVNSPVINSGLDEETAQQMWLQGELEASEGMRIHMFSHYPPYLYEPDEASNYDNLDEPGRGWLLDLLQKYRVEAFHSGHVHQFFYKHHSGTDIYNIQATGNLRQDFSYLFRVGPAGEFGRDDGAKLGYCIVDVYPDGHTARFRRSYGATLMEGVEVESFERLRECMGRVGVHIRYPLGEVVTLPYMGPLDEFVRKRARNDYPLMALWELGPGTLRLPLTELTVPASRRIYGLLCSMGYKLGFFHLGVPEKSQIELYRELVDFVEVITPWSHLEEALGSAGSLRTDTGVPVYLANIMSSLDIDQGGGKFSHFMGYGFRGEDLDGVMSLLPVLGSVDGFVFEVGEHESPPETIEKIKGAGSRHGFKALMNVRLASEDPAVYPRGEVPTANRVAETVLASYLNPDVRVLFDTFMDHDRGYFPRMGLYDRLLNPRRPANVMRWLNAALKDYKDFHGFNRVEDDTWTILEFTADNNEIRLMLPHGKDSDVRRVDGRIVDLTNGLVNPENLCDGSAYLVIR